MVHEPCSMTRVGPANSVLISTHPLCVRSIHWGIIAQRFWTHAQVQYDPAMRMLTHCSCASRCTVRPAQCTSRRCVCTHTGVVQPSSALTHMLPARPRGPHNGPAISRARDEEGGNVVVAAGRRDGGRGRGSWDWRERVGDNKGGHCRGDIS